MTVTVHALEGASVTARDAARYTPGIWPSAVSVQAESELVVPGPIRQVVDAWRAAGSPSQEGIEWPRERWLAAFPSHAATFTRAPGPPRSHRRPPCLRPSSSQLERCRTRFPRGHGVGYGRVGPGPYRVLRVLAAAPAAGAQLQAAANSAVHGRPVEAYGCLGDHGAARLPHLGSAFGTKFLYFCSPIGPRPALILDRLVARWLRENVGLAFNELRWSTSSYARYLEAMFGWADELGLAADELELCIFSTQARVGESQWAPR